MRLVPIITRNKQAFYEATVAAGDEGVMVKDISAIYESRGRPKAMYKWKRFEEVDCFVTGFEEGDPESGWKGLVGALQFSCYRDTADISKGKHMVAVCSNLTLEQRKEMSICTKCLWGAPTLSGQAWNAREQQLEVIVVNDDGHNRVTSVKCPVHGDFPGVTLKPNWFKRVAAVKGQEWTPRVFRLKHAVIDRWRIQGADSKSPLDCGVDLQAIQARWEKADAE